MVRISDAVWEALLDALNALPPGVERVAFLDGFGPIGDGVVTTVTVPNADLHPGWYDISVEAMSEAGAHLRKRSMTRLAQVHTHGGSGCRHSGRDDVLAYSQRPGALSIVLPYHAIRRPRLTDGVVHIRAAESWIPLKAAEVPAWVQEVPLHFTFWRNTWDSSPTGISDRSAGRFSGRQLRAAFQRLASAFRRNTPL